MSPLIKIKNNVTSIMIMKIFCLIALFLLLNTNFVKAGSCPIMVKKIDNLLSQTKQLSKEQLSEIKKLRDEGHKAHKEGKHADSVTVLKQALKLLQN